MAEPLDLPTQPPDAKPFPTSQPQDETPHGRPERPAAEEEDDQCAEVDSGLRFAQGDCIGIHVPPACPDAMALDWDAEHPRSDRIRVQEFTCACQPIFYEFCQSGGLFFIRRTRTSDGNVLIEETPRLQRKIAKALWSRLLKGAAY
ncbi:hypothetical protein AB0L05_32750 [Nonomuraea pusilla]|uniref:hypothetical protein n=1 Tax=Nonomuraea pusilla TaxID=46177 RepID=UPI003320DCC3